MSALDSPFVAAIITVLGSYILTQFGAKQSRKERDTINRLENEVKELKEKP